MNDFTKEELKIILKALPLWIGKNSGGELKQKIISMIDNYCEHESTYTDYDFTPDRCKKCLKIAD